MPRSPETGHNARAGAGVMWIGLCVLALLSVPSTPAAAQRPVTISARTTGLHRNEGFLPFYLDSTGRLLIEVPDSVGELELVLKYTQPYFCATCPMALATPDWMAPTRNATSLRVIIRSATREPVAGVVSVSAVM